MEKVELQKTVREIYKLINYNNPEFEWNENLRQARKLCNKIQHSFNNEEENKYVKTVFILSDCPEGYWYSFQKDMHFEVAPCTSSDLRDVEGFAGKDPNDCYRVLPGGDFTGNIIDKKHCSEIL